MLRAAREELGVRTREVADALNLPVHIIESLEADDFDLLPPTVFTRGYLRSYARLLELDADAVVKAYPQGETEVEVFDKAAGARAQLWNEKYLLASIGVAALLVAVVVIGLLFWLLEDGAPEPAEDADLDDGEPISTVLVESPTVLIAQPEVEQAVDTGHAAEEILQEEQDAREVTDAENVRQPIAQASSAAAAATVLPALAVPASAVDGAARRITEFGDDMLVIRFSEECWVEVKSTTGETLYSDLSRAEATLELIGKSPFRILLGYAPGVDLMFNGEPIALAQHTRNNVATLVLGQ